VTSGGAEADKDLILGQRGYVDGRMANDLYDVAIIGGGPAGSTAATLLARAGRRVVVFEREKFPRFHIGESLLPASMKTFTRLGVHEKFRQAGFLDKFGGEIAGACSEKGEKFYFEDGLRSKNDRSYQVTRAEFDKVLLDHSRESGAEVREETVVEELLFQSGRVEVCVRSKTTNLSEIVQARYLIDASGRNSIVGAHFKLKRTFDDLQKVSIFAHFEGVVHDAGRDGTLTRMVRALDRWFWVIPLKDGRTSIGVVLDTTRFRESKQSPETFLEAAIAEQPLIATRMEDARRISPVSVAADFSYHNSQLTGDCWMLAGDAAAFIDPVFSSGVFLAVNSGEQCADVLHEVLDYPSRRARLFARYTKRINHGIAVYLRFVRAWYKKEFVEVFLNPQDFFQLPPAVNAVLAGNINAGFAVRWRMWIFYFLVWMQKRYAVCPRRTLLPPKQNAAPSPVEELQSVA
jgi:flavin-dependent dehydrogenase